MRDIGEVLSIRHPAPLLLSLCGALALVGCNRSSDTCHGGGKASVKRYDDCMQLCDEGDAKACDRLSALEPALHQSCSRRGDAEACKALCHGRNGNPTACARLRELGVD